MNSIVSFPNRIPAVEFEERRFQVYTDRQMDKIEVIQNLPEATLFEMKVVASVLPFRVNEYVINELINWDKVPNDPIYQLVFPQKGMLNDEHFERMARMHREGADKKLIQAMAKEIRDELNPHPAGQMEMNLPEFNGEVLEGVQHKYRETVLFFPSQGQTCHSYCTFCFRWAQFVGDKDLKMASTDAGKLHGYLREHSEVSDLLVTGGDPMVMKTKHLVQYLEPLLEPEYDHIQTIRIGTKALTFWPYRFVTDKDSEELLDLFTRLVDGGKHVAIMAHYNHWQEITTDIAEEAFHIYRDAIKQVSGLARTARGPSMSAGPGKVEIQGITEIKGEKVFVLRFIQGRNPVWVQRPFFAQYSETATWLHELKPAFGEEKFFFEDEFEEMKMGNG